jgi:hypothetical protein
VAPPRTWPTTAHPEGRLDYGPDHGESQPRHQSTSPPALNSTGDHVLTFSVVTPCLDPGPLLAETVASVLGQRMISRHEVELQYLIIDGGSTDGTLDYLRSLSDPRIKWVSEPDRSMYDALAKGFAEARGDVRSYLNAGDIYHPHAFEIVADTMPLTDGWLTGMAITYNQRGDVVDAKVPFRYRRKWFELGLYDGRILHFPQQESTFWSSEVAATTDLSPLKHLRLAGDGYLWVHFAQHVQLSIVAAHLGGFRLHEGQLSQDLMGYRQELATFTRRPLMPQRALATVDRILWYAPLKIKKRLNPRGLIIWDGDRWR